MENRNEDAPSVAVLARAQTTTSSAHQAAANVAAPKPRRSRLFVLGLCVLALAAVAYPVVRWARHAAAHVETDNAYVSGHIHQIGPRVAGTVAEVLVDDNAVVRAGDVLVRLDRSELEVKKLQAEARAAQVHAQVQKAERDFARAQAALEAEQAQAVKTELDLRRARQLFGDGSGAISRQEYDHADAAHRAQQAAVKSASAALDAAQASCSAMQWDRKAAEAALAEVELQLSYCDIKAPAAGRIGRKSVEAGNRVTTTQPLMALVAEEIWITANFKETQMARCAPGAQATIRIDSLPGVALPGIVESFSPAAGSQFALLPPDNATGNFTKIVQRIPVKIRIAAAGLRELAGRIVPGMSAVVEVEVER